MIFAFGKIETNFPLSDLTKNICDLYSIFNQENFNGGIVTIYPPLTKLTDLIYKEFRMTYNSMSYLYNDSIRKVLNTNNKVCVLLFSGGLDSCFQALDLKRNGYDVILLHARNLNQYENNVISNNCVRTFAEKNNFKLEEINIWHNQRQTNPNRKFWPENPIKNQLLISIAIDYCIENNLNTISLGDDNNLALEETVRGVNTTDAREVLDAALYAFNNTYDNLNIITISNEFKGNKEIRLKALKDNDLLDDYCSCVGPGRLIASQNNRYRDKFKLDLPKWNCCTCRKCCMHLLIMHYSKEFDFTLNKEVLDRCWDKLANTGKGADYALFNSSIPEEKRIKTLFDY